MQKPLTFLGSMAIAALMALPLAAQDEPNADTVMATVNGEAITLGHMIAARAGLPQQYQELPDEVLFPGILDQLIQQTALAQSNSGDVPKRIVLQLQNERRSLIAGNVIEASMAEPITDADIEAAYRTDFLEAEPEPEFNASHILVETQEEALTIIADLEGGADFAEMAKEKSTGPSGPRGGSLGWFGRGQMVPPFEAAVMALEPGQVSAPVQTQFGWHVVTLNEKRLVEPPALDAVRDEIAQQLQQIRVQQMIEATTAASEIDRTGAEGIDPAILKNLDWLD